MIKPSSVAFKRFGHQLHLMVKEAKRVVLQSWVDRKVASVFCDRREQDQELTLSAIRNR